MLSAGSPFYAIATGSLYCNEPRDYTIEANRGQGGGPPQTGWTPLATITGDTYSSRMSVVSLAGANWIRMRVATNGSIGTAGSWPLARYRFSGA
jgi:hypothetical protein